MKNLSISISVIGFVGLLCLAANSLAGPIFPTRTFILAPAFRPPNDTTKAALFLRQQGIWGNLARGYQSADDRFGWSISFGGIIQFVEWEHSMIYLTGDAEVLADTHNDISFNPRAIFWTEGFVYSNKIGATELSVGYIHRCHHDIDDLDNNLANPHQERTLIYGSAMARAVWRRIAIFGDSLMFLTPTVQLDQYLIRQDDRIPNPTDRGNDVAKLHTSVTVGYRADLAFTKRLGFDMYARAQSTDAFYNSFRGHTGDVRLELGLAFSGVGSRMEVFYGMEQLEDDLNNVTPTNSSYIYLGFRFIGANVGI